MSTCQHIGARYRGKACKQQYRHKELEHHEHEIKAQ